MHRLNDFLNLRLSGEMRERLAQRAGETGFAESELVRQALSQFLDGDGQVVQAAQPVLRRRPRPTVARPAVEASV